MQIIYKVARVKVLYRKVLGWFSVIIWKNLLLSQINNKGNVVEVSGSFIKLASCVMLLA